MNSLSRVWRVGAFGLVVALFAAACADDQGAAVGGPPPVVTGSIAGTVTITGTSTPVVGALVGTTPATSTALTDASGNYKIENIPIPASGSASFAVTASKQDLTTGTGGTATVSLTTAAPNRTGVNLTLDQPPGPPAPPTTGNLNVLVTNSAGVPQSGASVVATRQGGSALPAVTTDANGFAVFTGITAGAYTVTASKTISNIPFKASGGVNVVAGETAFLQLTLGRDFGQTVFPNFRGAATTPTDIDFIPVAGSKDSNPDIDCNVIRTQHMFVVRVRNAAGQVVSGVKVNWALNISENGTVSLRCPDTVLDDPAGCTVPTVPGNTGSIVDSDDPDLDPFRARTGLNPAFILDTRTAVTFTNDQNGPNNSVSFNGNTVNVGEGQSWIIITSPVEGVTDVIASSSDIKPVDAACGLSDDPATACDKDFAIKRWVNWNIGVAELTGFDTPGSTRDPFDHPNTDCSSDGNGGWDCDGEISNGTTVLNVLSRGFDADCGARPAPGTDCELVGDNHDFISIVGRLRPDSPFNFSRGIMRWTVTDDSPDVDFWGEGASNGTDGFSDRDGCDEDGTPGPPWQTCNAEHNGPSDDQYWVVGTAAGNPQTPGSPVNNRNRAYIEFDANNSIFNGGIITLNPDCSNPCDEDDFVGWGVVQVRLDPSVYFCTDVDGDGDCNPAEPGGDTFSPAYAALVNGTVDNQVSFEVLFLDEFGEICGVFRFNKKYVTSRLTIVKNVSPPRTQQVGDPDGASLGVDRVVKYHTIQRGEQFSYTITVTNVGEVNTPHVRITDTLPRFGRQFIGPPDTGTPGGGGGVRDGHQAFQYLTDRAAFDPQAIVYGVDEDDNGFGDTIDECIVGRQAGNANAAAYVPPQKCGTAGTITEAGSVEAARALAIAASVSEATKDQIVFIQYYDQEILGRNLQSGGQQNEDSVEITLAASTVVKYGTTGANPNGSGFSSIPGNWCNIATVTDGPLNRGTDGPLNTSYDPVTLPVPQSFDADTLCHRVIEALLDIRKTAYDAVSPAGSLDSFQVEIANLGSATLTNVTISDSMDIRLYAPDSPRLTASQIHLNTTNFPGATVSAVDNSDPAFDRFTVTIPSVPAAGFKQVYRVVFQSSSTPGTFCNRVTAKATTPSTTFTETDIACVTILPGAVEFDVTNEDGTLSGATFSPVKEAWHVGENGDAFVYEVTVTNQGPFQATSVVVTDAVAVNGTGTATCQAIKTSLTSGPAASLAAAPATCNFGNGWRWVVGTLLPGEGIRLVFTATAVAPGNDENRVTVTSDQVNPGPDNEPTSIVQ